MVYRVHEYPLQLFHCKIEENKTGERMVKRKVEIYKITVMYTFYRPESPFPISIHGLIYLFWKLNALVEYANTKPKQQKIQT